jgi:putative endonuclease
MQPAVYILTNRDHRVLYTGVTANLPRRLHAHRLRLEPRSFTAKYHVDKLVYFELHRTMVDAIAREKQLKGGSRAKKLALIESVNPGWQDLAVDVTAR